MTIKLFDVSSFFIRNQCYLIEKEGECLLIDPAWEYEVIATYILNNQLTLKGVLLTHSHRDHTDLAEQFSLKYQVPIYIGKKEADISGFTCENLNYLSHHDQIYLGNFSIHTLLTPGHTAGSVCYLIENHIFTGDTVFIEGVGGCYDKTSNPVDLFYSIQFLKNYLPATTLFWPGHSYGQSPGKDLTYLLKNNLYFQLDKMEHFVSFRTRKNQKITF